MKNVTGIVIIGPDQLSDLIRSAVRDESEHLSLLFENKYFPEEMNREQAAVYCGVSAKTIDIWSQEGIIPRHHRKGKTRFLRSELQLQRKQK